MAEPNNQDRSQLLDDLVNSSTNGREFMITFSNYEEEIGSRFIFEKDQATNDIDVYLEYKGQREPLPRITSEKTSAETLKESVDGRHRETGMEIAYYYIGHDHEKHEDHYLKLTMVFLNPEKAGPNFFYYVSEIEKPEGCNPSSQALTTAESVDGLLTHEPRHGGGRG